MTSKSALVEVRKWREIGGYWGDSTGDMAGVFGIAPAETPRVTEQQRHRTVSNQDQ